MTKQPDNMDCPECGGTDTLIKRKLKMNGMLVYECEICFNEEEIPT